MHLTKIYINNIAISDILLIQFYSLAINLYIFKIIANNFLDNSTLH